MAYAVPQDLLTAWPKTYTTGFTTDELRVFIARADAIIDAYLARTYTVPFATDATSTPALIRNLSTDLAMLDVLHRMPETPEWVRDRITRAYELLKMLANGEISVPGAAEATDTGVVQSTTSGYVPTFGAAASLDERVDPSRAEDESDARDVE